MQNRPPLDMVREWVIERAEKCWDKQTFMKMVKDYNDRYAYYYGCIHKWEIRECLKYIRERNKKYREARRDNLWQMELEAMDERIAKEILQDIKLSVLSVEDATDKEKQKTLLELIQKGVARRRSVKFDTYYL